MRIQVAASIVLYKTALSDLDGLLASSRDERIGVSWFFIDNSPTDALRHDVHVRWPEAIYVHRPDNPGYGAGHNIGIRHSIALKIAYHLVLNADIRYAPGTLEQLMAFMNVNPNVAHVMPRVLNVDGTVQRLCKMLPTPIDLLGRRFLPASWMRHRRSRFERWDTGYDKTVWTPYLSGCFMFLRTQTLEDVGGFDERFFMYPEDLDLTRRLAAQHDTVFWPGVSVIHEHGAASYKSLRMLSLHIWNMCNYFNKWGWLHDPDRQRLNARALQYPVPYPCVEPQREPFVN